MWPFNKNQSPVPARLLEDAMDELGLVRLNDMNGAIEAAIQKHLDPSSLDGYEDDQSGHFNTEFNLVATAARMKGLYRREPWVYTCSSIIARTMSTIPYEVVNCQTGEIDKDHPLNKFLNAGNDLQDNTQLNWAGSLDLILGGNEFLVIDGEKIIHVPIEFVEIKYADKTDTEKYPIEGIYIRSTNYPANTKSAVSFVPWENVIHFKMPNPFSPYVGLSMVAAASRPILLDRHKNEFELAFYLRGATNAGVIETTEDITKNRMERLMRTFESAFTGRRNWFRQLFLPKGAKWVSSGLTMAEMEHLEGLRENRITLLAVLGVPPMKVGIVQDVNRSTAEIQNETFYENTIIPMSRMTAAGWNNSWLVKHIYKAEVMVRPNFDGIDAIGGGILIRSQQAKSLDNIATINEQRHIAKLPPLKPTDPRGTMFAIELTKLTLDPFGALIQPHLETLGPEGETSGALQTVEIPYPDIGNPHTHFAEVDEQLTGKTTTTEGDVEGHVHEIIMGEVQPSGMDNHVHPNLDLEETEREEKTFQRVKQITIGVQEGIEKGQGRRFLTAYERNLTIKMEQVKDSLRQGITDVRSVLQTNVNLRVLQYQKDAEKVLQETMSRGFVFAQTQTRNMSGFSKKAFNYSAQDELAIEIIKERTASEQRRTLAIRNINNYFGFDRTSTEQIQTLIERGLEEGLTTETIARNISRDFGENYGDQAFTIARTETLTAISQGIMWQNQVLQEVFSEVNKQWFHVGDVSSNPDARKGHATFEREGRRGIVPSNYVYVNPDTGASLGYPRDPRAIASEVINCRCALSSVIPNTAQSNAEQIINRG
jgi:HK97 family phage portal protein